MDKIPEWIQPEHSMEKAQEDVVVLEEKKGKEPVLMGAALKRSLVKVQEPIYHYNSVFPFVGWGLFLLAIFVLYQAWWVPSYRPTLQLPTQPTDTSAVSRPPILSQITRWEDAMADVPQTRLVNPLRRFFPVSVPSGVKAALKPAAKPSPQPRTRNTSHFTVRFDGDEDQATWMRMQAILEYAYQEIGQKFGYVPDRPIKVVLHMNQQFVGETGTPAWADTLFDQASGTIHIPAVQALDDLAWFSRVVRHEFVHALLHARMNTQPTVAPTWLVEGLAIQLTEDSWPDLDEIREKHPPFIPLASLQGRWKGIPAGSLPMAYVEADLATRSLTERYGIHGVRQVLNVLRAGQSLDAAMQAKLSLSYDKFQQQWAEDFKVNLQPDMS